MKLDFLKINLKFFWGVSGRKFSGPSGLSPRKYWLWFLFFFVILLLGTTTFSVFLFLSLNARYSAHPADLDEISEIKINLRGLEQVSQSLVKKRGEFDEAFQAPIFRDPSL